MSPTLLFGVRIGAVCLILTAIYETAKLIAVLIIIDRCTSRWSVDSFDVIEAVLHGVFKRDYLEWDADAFKKELIASRFSRRFKSRLDDSIHAKV